LPETFSSAATRDKDVVHIFKHVVKKKLIAERKKNTKDLDTCPEALGAYLFFFCIREKRTRKKKRKKRYAPNDAYERSYDIQYRSKEYP
jgi:hypothetical protein